MNIKELIDKGNTFQMSLVEHKFRASASVIIIIPINGSRLEHNYEVLLIKRTEATSNVKDHYVFPGGALDITADSATEWLKYFAHFGISWQDIKQSLNLNVENEICLRLTALREIFEEVGVLLYQNKWPFKHRKTKHLTDFNINYWQEEVHQNGHKFLDMCREYKIFPDLWALNNWSLWRSPITSLRKFDTIYFVTVLEEKPTLLLEPHEVDLALWETPKFFLDQHLKYEIWLPPTIYYELIKLKNISNIPAILEKCEKYRNKSLLLMWPVYFYDKENTVAVLPGDEFYPIEPLKHIKMERLPANAHNPNVLKHRIIMKNMYNYDMELNFSLDTYIPIKNKL